MQDHNHTIIIRHKRENLKKCSLRGLESREDLTFYTYPQLHLPVLENTFILSMVGEPLTRRDADMQMLLVDGTWRYAEKMHQFIDSKVQLPKRTLPANIRTAYPRRQEDCQDPERGLASVEALYIAYKILGWDTEGLLDHYHWREDFIESLDWKGSDLQ